MGIAGGGGATGWACLWACLWVGPPLLGRLLMSAAIAELSKLTLRLLPLLLRLLRRSCCDGDPCCISNGDAAAPSQYGRLGPPPASTQLISVAGAGALAGSPSLKGAPA